MKAGNTWGKTTFLLVGIHSDMKAPSSSDGRSLSSLSAYSTFSHFLQAPSLLLWAVPNSISSQFVSSSLNFTPLKVTFSLFLGFWGRSVFLFSHPPFFGVFNVIFGASARTLAPLISVFSGLPPSYKMGRGRWPKVLQENFSSYFAFILDLFLELAASDPHHSIIP